METTRLMIHARGETRELALRPEGLVLGRVPPADIVLESRMVSRRHARVFRDPFGRWIFEDLGSSNGTFVQGRRIDACPVLPGEPVHIGPFALKIAQPQDWLTAGTPPPSFDANLVVSDFETEFFQESSSGAPPKTQPCPARWAELADCLAELTNLTALYPEVCRHLGKMRNTVAMVLRVPAAAEPLPAKPQVCAAYLSDSPYDATMDDTIGFYPQAALTPPERAYRLSRHVIEKARTTGQPAMAKTIFSSDTQITVTLIDEFSPRGIIGAPLEVGGKSLDLLYLDFPLDESVGAGPEEVFAFVRLAAREIARVRKGLSLMELRAGRSILDSELSRARDMQAKLTPGVPEGIGANLDVAVHYRPALWVGGDYADLWSINPEHLAFAAGHVDSTGLPAALVLAGLRLALRSTIDATHSLADLLARVNQQLLAHPLRETSTSLFLGLLDLSKGVLRFVNAAHPQPLVLLPQAGWSALGQPGAARLGAPEATFHEHSLKLKDIAALLLYTPGVTQTRSPRGEEFGTAGLVRTLKATKSDSAQSLVQTVADAMETFRQSLAQRHDLTLLALTPKPKA